MSVRTVVDMCSHLQNASAARLGMTSVKSSKKSLQVAMAMQRQGLLAMVYRAGSKPPTEEEILTKPMEPVTPANVGDRRLWIGLKYHLQQPVLKICEPITTSKRRVNVQLPDMHRLLNGQTTRLDKVVMRGLEPGECLFLDTSEGLLELREALTRKVGGKVLVRTA